MEPTSGVQVYRRPWYTYRHRFHPMIIHFMLVFFAKAWFQVLAKSQPAGESNLRYYLLARTIASTYHCYTEDGLQQFNVKSDMQCLTDTLSTLALFKRHSSIISLLYF